MLTEKKSQMTTDYANVISVNVLATLKTNHYKMGMRYLFHLRVFHVFFLFILFTLDFFSTNT